MRATKEVKQTISEMVGDKFDALERLFRSKREEFQGKSDELYEAVEGQMEKMLADLGKEVICRIEEWMDGRGVVFDSECVIANKIISKHYIMCGIKGMEKYREVVNGLRGCIDEIRMQKDHCVNRSIISYESLTRKDIGPGGLIDAISKIVDRNCEKPIAELKARFDEVKIGGKDAKKKD